MFSRPARRTGRPRCAALAAWLVVVSLLICAQAHAQGNSFAAPSGGRSALMGNTGTALAIDGSAPFLNPATIVRMDANRFAFSVNFYNYSVTHFSNWHEPGNVDGTQFGNVSLSNTGITSSGFGGLPSTFCLFFALTDGAATPSTGDSTLHPGRQKLSICLGNLESQGVSFSALPFTGTTSLGQTVQAQSLVQSWNRLYAGPSYSVSITDRLALGASLHAVFTNDSFILASSAITNSVANGGVQSSFGAAGGGSSIDLAGTVGGIYRFGDYTAGLSVALPAVHLTGSYTGTLDSEYSSGTAGSATISTGSGSFTAAPPIRIAAGVGAELGRWTLEADAAVVIPALTGFSASLTGNTATLAANQLTATTFQSTFGVQEHVVVNAGAGGEYFFKPTFSFVGGASINFTAQPPLSPSLTVGNVVQERGSLATISGGVGSYGQSGNLLLGLQLGYGWGQSLAANPYVTPNQWAVVDTSSYNVLVILAGSTSLRALGRAVERIEHVIVGNPTDPDATLSSKTATPGKPAPPAPAPTHPTTP